MNFNFIIKIKTYQLLIFCAIVLSTVNGLGQSAEFGIPFIQNYPPRVYGYESQNYSIIQDTRGVFYIANLNGILEYDGSYWNLIKINGIPELELGVEGDIFAGGYNEFGILQTDQKGGLKYNSLINKIIDTTDKDFGHVSDILQCNNGMIFIAGSRLFLYKYDKIKLIDNCEFGFRGFRVNEKVFLFKNRSGLYEFNGGALELIENGDFFQDKFIVDIIPLNNNLLIKCLNTNFFYLYKDGEISKLTTDIDELIGGNNYAKGIALKRNLIAIGTNRDGILIINNQGKFITRINKSLGLNDDDVSDLFVDNSGNLWATLNNGISRIEIPSAFTIFDQNLGVKGGISSILRYNGVLYVATTQGVFYLTKDKELDIEAFKPVKGLLTDCNILYKILGKLYVSANNGVYEIVGDKANHVSKGYMETIYQPSFDSTLIFLLNVDGLYALKYSRGVWNELGSFTNLKDYYKTVAEDNKGNLWLGTEYKGIVKVDFANGFNINATAKSFNIEDYNEWIDVYSSSQGVLFSTTQGVYRYNYNDDDFYIDTILGLDFSKGDKWVYPIVEDGNKNLWYSSGIRDKFEKTTSVAYFNGFNNKYIPISSPFNRINDFTIEAIYPDTNSIVWFGSFDGLIKFNSKMLSSDTTTYKTLIRKITLSRDSVIGLGRGYMEGDVIVYNIDSVLPEYSYSSNDVRFEFSSSIFKSESSIEFQYYLEGYDDKWSEWTKESYKEYTNLSEGKYTFNVRSRDIYGKLSNQAVYRFYILPPIFRTWFAYLVYIVLITSFVIMVAKWRSYLFAEEKHQLAVVIKERTNELVMQKERAEEVLANVLPKQTADELKSKGRAKSKRYKLVTVLFSDMQGFTKIAEVMNPELLIDELDKFFLYFDSVVEKQNIEKIKTIGDAYMCAGGIPEKNRTNPIEVVLAALDIQQHMSAVQPDDKVWDLRIGIHTGPVIAGVVGSKKYSYDIWGDTVNIASRMESSGEAGKINISGYTYELVKEYFVCHHRGKMPVKYKGDIDMYFVEKLKPEYSIDGDGIRPNQKFNTKFQLVQLDDIEELILNKMEEELPKNLYYHNLKHTVDIITQVELIGREEGINEEEMLLIKTAAIFHDVGFTIGYDDHEELSIKMAKDTLPKFGYTDEQIQLISEIIYATKLPPSPKNKLEEIICDADLDYLGRSDFIPVSNNLFKELSEYNLVKGLNEWNKIQLKFIEKHSYFTKTARKHREVNKQMQLEKIRKLIDEAQTS